MMKGSLLRINRLRVLKSGQAVYDEAFHTGVNIIRGENGSGKSTISDFIFYVLGGEYDNWKTAAQRCDEVQAEIYTKSGIVTIKREVGSKQTPAYIFYGSMEEASNSGLDGWERHPIRRSESSESISQILFRSIGIPEAKSEGSSNVTMHQILRLLYSDQRTPPTRLFRFESFDTRDIREAVGDLICGMNVYELYELQLELRGLDKKFKEKTREWEKLLAALPEDESLSTIESLNSRISQLEREQEALISEISNVDSFINGDELKGFIKNRESAKKEIQSAKSKISEYENKIEKLSLELEDLYSYANYLTNLSHKLPEAAATAEIIGNIEFTHCPACLSTLTASHDKHNCILCGTETDSEKEQSKYLQIKQDIQIQHRETSQLIGDKELAALKTKKELNNEKRNYESLLSEYTVNFDISISPRESFLAERNNRLGQIEKEIKFIGNLFDVAQELQRVSKEKADIQSSITQKTDRQKSLETQGAKRKSIALTKVSEIAKSILMADFDRQEEFKKANSVDLNFGDDAVSVDGEMNFSDSSSVILKNTAILSLFLASLDDTQFYHPRFLLLDNIEDKGMEEKRSHNYQKIIVNALKESKHNHQVIITTSMMNPELDMEEYVVGDYYTNENKTLNFSRHK